MVSGWVGGGWQEKSSPGFICQGYNIDMRYGNWLGCMYAMSWFDLHLTFDLAIVTLTFKIFSHSILETVKYRMLILGRTLVEGCRCTTLKCDLGMTFDPGPARMFYASIFETYYSYRKDMWIAAN